MKEKDFKEVLLRYDIGNHKSHKLIYDTNDGQVYELRTTKGKFALKLMHKLPEDYRLQLEVLSYLDKRGINVARNIQTRKKKLVLPYNKKKIVIQNFLKGKHLRTFNDPIIKEIANTMAKMHRALMSSKFTQRKSHKYKLRKLYWIKDPMVGEIQKRNLHSINKIDKQKLKQSYIHGDLSHVNILTRNNRLEAFIDFDDSDTDYIAYEVAIFLAHAFVRRKQIQKRKIKLFLKTYQRTIKLNEEELRAIYYLIQYRLFGILDWFMRHRNSKSHMKKEIEKGIKRSVTMIKRWNKFPIKDFLKLVSK